MVDFHRLPITIITKNHHSLKSRLTMGDSYEDPFDHTDLSGGGYSSYNDEDYNSFPVLTSSTTVLPLEFLNCTRDFLLSNNSISGVNVFGNNISNCAAGLDFSSSADDEKYVLFQIFVGLVLGLIILATIIGNFFVLAAIWMERTLHSSVANYLILSLAVADLMVAGLVMPLGAYKEVSQKWLLGARMCDMWTVSDVLACTASILHLVAIALDRYWAVTSIDYIHNRNPRRIITMIVMIWIVALLVALSPLFGWKDDDWWKRVEEDNCLVSQELSYQIYATLSSFYVPLAVILFLYYRIYETARKRIRRRPPKPITGVNLLPPEATTTTSLMNSPSPEKSALLSNGGGARSAGPTPESTPLRVVTTRGGGAKTKRETMESKRERKAAKTLAIITGAFIICWLPFFVMALYDAISPPNPDRAEIIPAILLWLGYFNSTLNPIIYTIFSPEFRQAFKKILCGRHYATASRARTNNVRNVPASV